MSAMKFLISFTQKISFRTKLGLAIVLLTTGVTSLSVIYFYQLMKQFTIQQIQENLKQLGHTASLLFDDNDRQNIVRLTAEIQAEAKRNPQITRSDIQSLKLGATQKC